MVLISLCQTTQGRLYKNIDIVTSLISPFSDAEPANFRSHLTMFLLLLEHFFLGVVVAALVGVYLTKGREELLRVLVVGLKGVPGVGGIIAAVLKSEASNFIKQSPIGGGGGGKAPKVKLPEKGNLSLICPYIIISKLDLCEGGSFSPTIFKSRDIEISVVGLPHFDVL